MDTSIGDLYNVAMVCHEANRAYCLTIGDNTQKPWKEADEWQKQSSMVGVKGLVDNPSLTPEELHAMWCGQKLQDGWRYGTEKDAEAKTHPCMVPYNQLPEDQQMKDHLFHAIVRTLLKLPPGFVHVQ